MTYVSATRTSTASWQTPTSIFEDSADEIWIFMMMVNISVTTVNTVTVTVHRPIRVALPRGATQVANRRAAACDVTDGDRHGHGG